MRNLDHARAAAVSEQGAAAINGQGAQGTLPGILSAISNEEAPPFEMCINHCATGSTGNTAVSGEIRTLGAFGAEWDAGNAEIY